MAKPAIRAGRSLAVLVPSVVGALWVMGSQQAQAAPADPCALMIPGHMKDVCEQTQKLVGTGSTNPISDPLGSIAQSCGQGASWLLGQLSSVVDGPTTKVNFTNMGFLRTYAIVFAASSILVILVWLYAVLRRVINGVGPVTAVVEAVGGLWLAVLASAFTPVALAGVVVITDELTAAIATAAPGAQVAGPDGKVTTSPGPGAFFNTLTTTLNGKPQDVGGDIVFILLAIVTMVCAVFLWAELLVRVAILYVGGAIAPAVYAGLVDKHFWTHVWRWVSIMAAFDVAKPFLIIVLILGESVAENGAPATGIDSILAGVSIMGLAAFGTATVYRLVPVVGDHLSYDKTMRGQIGHGPMAQHMQGTAAVMQAAIRADGNRGAAALPILPPAAAQRLRPEAPPIPHVQARGANHPDSAAHNPGPPPLSSLRQDPPAAPPRPGAHS